MNKLYHVFMLPATLILALLLAFTKDQTQEQMKKNIRENESGIFVLNIILYIILFQLI